MDIGMNDQTVIVSIPPVEEWPLKQLKSVCRHNKIKGYTKMDRKELVHHVKEIIKSMKPTEEEGII
ncbi:hypothetical protein [Bacillus toyonensis]|uniref:hypothetical protein n=1 Tax=Bacillus toyonensis TaxID=155322 RepID=UPI0005393EB5|nr:hypothetical protein [Bacillus toyonensis]PDY91452.1 hypothetical protein CON67_10285 [Bacillus toyonensis]